MNKLEIELVAIYRKAVISAEKIEYDQVSKKRLSNKIVRFIIKEVKKKYNISVLYSEIINKPFLNNFFELIKSEFTKKQLYLAANKKYIPKAIDKSFYELSHAQRRLWILYKMEPRSPFYNVKQAWKVEGGIKIDILKESINYLVDRHEILRTNFQEVNGHPVQVVHDNKEINYEAFDFSKDKLSVREGKMVKIITKITEHPFNLETDALLRVAIIKNAKKEYSLIIVLHHIVVDIVSLGIFYCELFQIYEAIRKNKKPILSKLFVQYKDYSEHEQSNVNKKRIKSQEKYWFKTLGNDLPMLDLPIDKARPFVQTYNGAIEKILLEIEMVENLKKIAHENDVTLFVLLFSIFNIFISHITKQQDIVIGTLITNRNFSELQNSIGCYSNNLAIRSEVINSEKVNKYLLRIKSSIISAMKNSEVSFDYLVEKLSPERDASRSPIFNVLFRSIVLDKKKSNNLIGLKLSKLQLGHDLTHFDLMPTVVELPNNFLSINFEYNTDLFFPQTIKQFLQIYKTLIEQIIKNPNQKISELSIVTKTEKKQLLKEFNNTKVEYPKNKTLIKLFEAQVEKTPKGIAVEFEQQKLTYKELNIEVNKLAHYLKEEKNIKPGSIVALMTERTPEAIVSILAILKNNCAYLPIDPDYPKARIEYMLKQSRSKLLLVDREEKLEIGNWKLKIINISSRLIKERIIKQDIANLELNTAENNLAYVIYTSGSTGDPKGVEIEHKAILNTLYWLQDEFKLKKNDIVAQKTALSFTDSVWEIFWTLLNGSKLSIISDNVVRDPRTFIKELRNKKITYTQFVPALMTLFLEYGRVEEISKTNSAKILPHLKFIFNGGEALPPALANRWYRTFPNVKIANIYGMTESAIYATNYIVPKVSDENQISAPLGKPIANTEVYIIDKNNRINPRGISGEIAIKGISLARGYLHKKKLAEQSFIKNIDIKGTLYKTGDMGKIDHDFNLQYLGRIDQQVQIRGYRIEVGEIETCLRKHKEVSQCAVITKQSKQKTTELVAFLTSEEKTKSDEIREYLKQNIPSYMVPRYIIEIEEFPLNVHGKIDRKALARLKFEVKEKKLNEAPKTEIEKRIAKIWQEVLGLNRISRNDNFFGLGGHSLSAIDVLHRVYQDMGVEIYLEDIFNNMELSKLAEIIKKKLKK